MGDRHKSKKGKARFSIYCYSNNCYFVTINEKTSLPKEAKKITFPSRRGIRNRTVFRKPVNPCGFTGLRNTLLFFFLLVSFCCFLVLSFIPQKPSYLLPIALVWTNKKKKTPPQRK